MAVGAPEAVPGGERVLVHDRAHPAHRVRVGSHLGPPVPGLDEGLLHGLQGECPAAGEQVGLPGEVVGGVGVEGVEGLGGARCRDPHGGFGEGFGEGLGGGLVGELVGELVRELVGLGPRVRGRSVRGGWVRGGFLRRPCRLRLPGRPGGTGLLRRGRQARQELCVQLALVSAGAVRPDSQERMVAAVTPTAAATSSCVSSAASRSLRRSLGAGRLSSESSEEVVSTLGVMPHSPRT